MLAAILLCASAPAPLHVEGSKLIEDGREVILRGVDVPSLESSSEGDHVFRSCRVALEDWHANCVRLPLSQDQWFAKIPGPKKKVADYRNQVMDTVTYVTHSDGYVVLDLESSDAGQWAKNLGPHNMPDANSENFWKDVAHAYRGNPRVLFELYGPTHDVEAKTWLEGGPVTEGDLSYKAVGMSKLLEDVRKAGAKNVVVVRSVDGASLPDPSGNGVVHDVRSPEENPSQPRILTALAPGAKSQADHLFHQIKAQNLSWIAQNLRPKAEDSLITDWTYALTPIWGERVKRELAGN
ncbi:MAG TPA: cellulase family glycosylhydrolase [Fimbriimonas sp.]|nr:cellulase family glycosylhydrolase [Fimbriimonas sp.]